MHLKFRNVNSAFKRIVEGIHKGSIPTKRSSSRNGPVIVVEEPVLVTYEKPRERVLFNAARDCNPFMHLYESLWMIAGRNDVAPMVYYAKQFKEYTDDGKTLNGAYGYRWRKYGRYRMATGLDSVSQTGVDQIKILVDHLKQKPDSRRAVLQMWNVEDDLLKIDSSKDVCCNLSVMFSIREEKNSEAEHKMAMPFPPRQLLDMTVTNRSNDLVWGMLGANVVHFSILQEYVAAQLGVEVGIYNHFTNNLHAYESNWKPEEWLSSSPSYASDKGYDPFTLVQIAKRFDDEVVHCVGHHEKKQIVPIGDYFAEPFLRTVAEPMFMAFHYYKDNRYDKSLGWADKIAAEDWKIAARGWLERRINKKEIV